jgi:hypothetical protein
MVELALMSAIVKNLLFDGGAASVWEILPAGAGKHGQVGVWYAVLAVYVERDLKWRLGGT